MTDEDPTLETWHYMGQRLMEPGKLSHAWLDATGAEVYYKNLTAFAIGGVYHVPVFGREEGATRVRPDARYLGEEHGRHELASTWQLEHRASVTEAEMIRAEKRAKAEGPAVFGELTLAELKQRLSKAPAPRRRVLLAQALDYLSVR